MVRGRDPQFSLRRMGGRRRESHSFPVVGGWTRLKDSATYLGKIYVEPLCRPSYQNKKKNNITNPRAASSFSAPHKRPPLHHKRKRRLKNPPRKREGK